VNLYHKQVIRITPSTLNCLKSGSLFALLRKEPTLVWRTVPMLVRIARNSVDGRSIRITYGTDQQVIQTGVDGTLK